MTGSSQPLPLEALLAQEPGLRSLARRLLRDDHDAQDATQQSLLRALERPPAQRQSLRAYLAAILRHGVLDLRKGARARQLREQQAARGEALPSASEMAEREQTRRVVAEAVLALEEPYRATVWLRFYEDLAPRAVARRMGVPVNTVRTRLQRAVHQLRSALDQRHGGDGGAWRAALLPLAGMPAKGLLFASGAVMSSVMMKKIAVALVAAGMAASAWFSVDLGARPASPLAGTAARPGGERGTQVEPPASPIDPRDGSAHRTEASATAPAAPAWRIEGIVSGAGGAPLPRAQVAVAAVGSSHREDVGRVACDADGRYAVDLSSWRARSPLDRAALQLEVRAMAPAHHPATAGTIGFPAVAADRELVLRRDVALAPGAVLGGRVLDSSGTAIGGALVRLHPPGDEGNAIDARTDPDGTYVLGVTRAGPHVLEGWHPDVGWARIDALATRLDQDQTAPDLVLEVVSTLRGRFVYEDGAPVAGVDVLLVDELSTEGVLARTEAGAARARGAHGAEGRTGPDGRFEFRCLQPGSYEIALPWYFPDQEQKRCVVATGPDETRIVIAQHRIRIRCEDEQERQLVPPVIAYDGWRDGGGPDAPPDAFGAGHFADGLFVPRGSRSCLKADEGAFHAHAWVSAPQRGNESEVVLTLREVRLSARLRVDLAGSAGQPVPECDVRLEPAVPGPTARCETVTRQPGGGVYRAAPGSYRLEVQPDPKAPGRGHWFPLTRAIVLEEDKETVVCAEATLGGRVRFTIHVPSRAPLPAVPGFTVTAPVAPGEEPRLGAKFTVQDEASGSWRSSGRAPSETPCTWGRLLAPGSHLLTIAATGFQTQLQPVVVRAGETTDVAVWLAR